MHPLLASAQDCDVRYRLGSSQIWITQSLESGESWTGTANNLNQLQNVGRNDAVVRTSGALGALADNRLIAAPGGSTVVLPPAIWTGLQLQRIDCQPHATVYDAGDFLEALGTSAAALAAQALADARKGAEDARDEALALVGSGMESLANQSATRHAEALAAWQSFQADAASAAGEMVVVMEQHFPELHLAVTASGEYAYGLPAATTALWRSHVQGTLEALQELDAQLGVSTAVDQILAVELAVSFPEAHAMATTPCRLDPAPFDRLGNRTAEIGQRLQELASALAEALWPAALADPLLAQLRASTQRLAQGPCEADLDALAASMRADRQAVASYLRNAQTALAAVDARALARGQETFATALQSLSTRTGTVLQLALEQERLDQAAEFRATELRQASQRLVGGTGRQEGVGWLSPEYWDRRARQGDPDELADDVQAVEDATARYDAAIQAREANWTRLASAWDTWRSEAVELSALVPRLQVTVRGTDELLRALASPPELRTAQRALAEASACLREGLSRVREEAQAIRALSAELLGVVVASLQLPTLSPELAARLEAAQQAFQAGTAAQVAEAAARAQFAAAATAAFVEVAALQLSLVDMTGGPDAYRTRAMTRLDQVEAAMRQMWAAREVQQTASAERRDALTALATALAGLVDAGRAERRAEEGISRLADALNTLEGDRAAVAAGVESLQRCTDQRAEELSTLVAATPGRLNSYLAEVAGIALSAAAAQVPPEVRAALDEALAQGNALVEAHGIFGSQALALGVRAQQAHTAHLTATASVLPFPQTDAPARVQGAHDAHAAFWTESLVLLQARGQINAAQGPFLTSLGALTSALQSAGLDAASSGAGIAFSALDLDLISDEYVRAQFLAERWGAAYTTFPARLAAFGASALPAPVTQIASGVNANLASMQTHLTALQGCVAQGLQSRAPLQNPTHILTAGTQAVSGFQTQAQGVMTDLGSLLNPTAILAGQAPTIFEAASTLQSRLNAMSSAGRSTFLELTAEARGQAQVAASCVQSRSGTIQVLANQVNSLMNPAS